MNLSKETLIVQYGQFFKLYLTINFKKNIDHYVVESKKMKIKIESTNLDLNEAKEEFSNVLDTVIKHLINNKTLFNVFDLLNIKQQNENKIILEKAMEMSVNQQMVKINSNELAFQPLIELNRSEYTLFWQK